MTNIPEEVLRAASTYQTPAPEPQPARLDGHFNLERFIANHLKLRRGPMAWNGTGQKWDVLCPFNPEHADGAAVVTRGSNGAIGFKCQHNSCSEKHWRDVREKFDGPREARANGGRADKGTPPQPPTPPRLVPGEEILNMSLPKTDFAIDPIISRPGLWLVNGSQKAGKTILAAQIALSLQAPESLMGWYTIPKACGALFI
jgi:hypothetical protein